MLSSLEEYKRGIYSWVKDISQLKTVPANRGLKITDAKYITIDFGTLEEMGTERVSPEKSEVPIENVDETHIVRYKQQVYIEFYGEETDADAIKLKQSILTSSYRSDLKYISIANSGISNNTVALEDKTYEERYLLSLLVYFSLQTKTTLEVIETINYTGKVNP